MKTDISIPQLEQLPLAHRLTIPESYLDEMGHMNVRWYMALYDAAVWPFFISFGLDETYYEEEQGGSFALQHFIRYLAEVRVGQTVAVRNRLVGRSAKRLHFIQFMINETTGVLASTLEAVGTHVDMRIRRSAPYPAHIAARMDEVLAQHQQLAWEAPLCGMMKP